MSRLMPARSGRLAAVVLDRDAAREHRVPMAVDALEPVLDVPLLARARTPARRRACAPRRRGAAPAPTEVRDLFLGHADQIQERLARVPCGRSGREPDAVVDRLADRAVELHAVAQRVLGALLLVDVDDRADEAA
jgi:hypothetical protein